MIKLSDYLMRRVAELGIKHVFLLPGGGSMHLVDSLGMRGDIEHVCVLHEQAAAIAADAYSQYTNNIGVALVTTGPGGTNALTGVAASWIDSIPVLVISGQVKRSDLENAAGARQKGPQEVDIVSMVKPIAKYAVTVLEPSEIGYHFDKAVHLARTGRPGPVWLDIPLDVQGAFIDETSLRKFDPNEFSPMCGMNHLGGQIDKVIHLLNNSAGPVILAGNGIRLSKAIEDFRLLIESLGLPVLTTWKAMDLLPEDHRLFFGRPGSVASRYANFIQQNSDFIMTIGARLDLPQAGFDYGNFAPRAKKVIVEIDPSELKKLKMPVDLAVNCDAKVFIQAFSEKLNAVTAKDRSAWLSKCRDWKAKYPVVLDAYSEEKEYVNTYVLIDALSEKMSPDDVFVPGSSGGASEIAMQAFRVKEGQRVFNSPGLGAMGFGLPAAIGACLASGLKRTVTVIGDGGLQHNIQELETVARLNLPLKIFVLNNNGYASIRATQKTHFKERYVCCDPSSGLELPDTRKAASAYGLATVMISNHKTMKKAIGRVLKAKGPVVCEVMIDPGQPTAPRVSSEVKPDGSIVSKPMEDLWPFLDRDEFRTNI